MKWEGHLDEETFFVREGVYRFDTLGQGERHSLEATSGAVVHVPSLAWHNYKNVGQTPGKLVVLVQPGDLIDFFRELGIPVTDRTNLPRLAGPPDLARVAAITKKHHVEMMGTSESNGG